MFENFQSQNGIETDTVFHFLLNRDTNVHEPGLEFLYKEKYLNESFNNEPSNLLELIQPTSYPFHFSLRTTWFTRCVNPKIFEIRIKKSFAVYEQI